jgi:hypothetical protein
VKITFHDRIVTTALATLVVSICSVPCASPLFAQQPPAIRTQGVVMKIDAAGMTIKAEDGQEVSLKFSPRVSFRRVPPGETDVTKATTIAVTDIGVGDRALAVGRPGDDKIIVATLVVAISKADIANRQSSEMADWQKRGIIGIVAMTQTGEITLDVRGPGGTKKVAIQPAPNAVIRRYTPESIKFQDAKPSTLAEIKNGDQVRARGDRTEDGSKMTAVEIVSGTFKELAATILSIDPAEKVMRVTDLATKKPVVVKITADSNLRKLPPQMAQMLAAQAHPPEEGAAGGRGGAPQGRGGDAAQGRGGDGRGPGGPGVPGGGRGRGAQDLGAMLERTPTMTLADLKNGDAIILLSTVGANDQLNVITMLAGVEPILTKPGTREMSLGGWSLEGGGGGN